MDRFLRALVDLDDWGRVQPSRKLLFGIPVAAAAYVLGRQGMWLIVAVIIAVACVASAMTFYARRRLGRPAPSRR